MLPIVTILLFLFAAFLGYFFLSGFIWGAGYYPTSRREIDAVAELLGVHDGFRFYDLGSGYGRMIVTMAERYKANATGIEIDPIKCWWTRRVIERKRLTGLVKVQESNFLKADISGAEGIFVFLSSEGSIMERLREKILRDCKAGTKIVSFEHKFKGWNPTKVEGKLTLYVMPESSGRLRDEVQSGARGADRPARN